MGLIDSILNIACLLLWLNWRSTHAVAREKAPPVSLAATLKKTSPRRASRWISLGVLLVVLAGRAAFYWNVGMGLSWTPSLRLGVVSVPFRSDDFSRMLLFSMLSFGVVLFVAYAWLLLISVINRRVSVDEPMQRLVRVQLGWLDCWPAALKLLTPLVVATLSWGLGSPLLVKLGLAPAPISTIHRWEQAVLLGVSSLLSWRFLLIGVCVLYVLNSYVYFGQSSFWSYVNTTGANLLAPLRRLPVRLGKVDFAPLLAIALVLVAVRWAAQWLPRAFQALPF